MLHSGGSSLKTLRGKSPHKPRNYERTLVLLYYKLAHVHFAIALQHVYVRSGG